MTQYGPILSIAGSDCSGGAGIEADIKTITHLGGYAMDIITASTVQNTKGVQDIYPITTSHITAQFTAIAEDIPPIVIKTGMLHRKEVIDVIAPIITALHVPLIIDPVLCSSSGYPLLETDAITSLKNNLIPLATIITPNSEEAALLSGITIKDEHSLIKAGHLLLELGSDAVVITGTDYIADTKSDIFITKNEVIRYSHPLIETTYTHGTGCSFSAALACFMAKGNAPNEAVKLAGDYVHQAIKNAVGFGQGNAPLNHCV